MPKISKAGQAVFPIGRNSVRKQSGSSVGRVTVKSSESGSIKEVSKRSSEGKAVERKTETRSIKVRQKSEAPTRDSKEERCVQHTEGERLGTTQTLRTRGYDPYAPLVLTRRREMIRRLNEEPAAQSMSNEAFEGLLDEMYPESVERKG